MLPVSVALRRESICTDMDMDKDTACFTASGKSFVCAHDWHVTACGTAYVFGCISIQRVEHFSPRFLCIIHGTSSFETIVGPPFEGRRSAIIVRTSVEESNIFSDQCYELLCFVCRDFADLRHGWITRAFPPARKNVEKRHKK